MKLLPEEVCKMPKERKKAREAANLLMIQEFFTVNLQGHVEQLKLLDFGHIFFH